MIRLPTKIAYDSAFDTHSAADDMGATAPQNLQGGERADTLNYSTEKQL